MMTEEKKNEERRERYMMISSNVRTTWNISLGWNARFNKME